MFTIAKKFIFNKIFFPSFRMFFKAKNPPDPDFSLSLSPAAKYPTMNQEGFTQKMKKTEPQRSQSTHRKMLKNWIDGMLEYWETNCIIHHSIIPLFQHSNLLALRLIFSSSPDGAETFIISQARTKNEI